MWKPGISTGVGFSEKAVWSRAARRHASKAQNNSEPDDEDVEMALGFKIHIEEITGGQAGTRVTIRWLKGHDSVLFESFCGMVKRKLEESIN